MSDPLCDNCHKEYQLKLTSENEMLCHLCMDNKQAVPLMDVMKEAGNLREQQEAMKKIWDEINKGEKK
jgi:hypothetical protein